MYAVWSPTRWLRPSARSLSIHATPIAAAPTIVSQPASQTAFAGTTVVINVVARGVPAPAYQWYKDGASIAGATGPALVLTDVQLASTGTYAVVITSSLGTVTSQPATLTVYRPRA